MPWFCCDDCGDTIKKPKIAAHCCRCSAYSFTCIDCSRVFTQSTVNQHTSCVTEHEKYALGATKPGGFAESGFFNGKSNGNGSIKSQQKQGNNNEPSGLEFLTTRPPWKCTICNVNCTSEETLHGHAAGAKHKRRARAALAAPKKEETNINNDNDNKEEEGKKSSDDEEAKTEEKKQKNKKKEIEKKEKKNKDGKIKWKKLAVKELKKQGGLLKLKKLKAALLQSAHVDDEPDEMMKQLAKCDKLVIEGKIVRFSSE